MNTLRKSFRLLSVLIVFSVAALVASCSEEETLNSVDKETVSSEASTDSYFEDVESLTSTVAFATNSEINGRSSGLPDDRLVDATVTVEGNDQAGTITIDFGDGTTRNGVTRKGKIYIAYEGARRALNSTHTITFENFYVNGVKVEGTRTVRVSAVTLTSITHEITLDAGKLTWNEGTTEETTATRDAHHFRTWDRTAGQVSILAEEGWAEGSNRNGVPYLMEVQEDIVFKASCMAEKKFLPVSGTKVLTLGANAERVITVNYGSGDCDNLITVTINGQTKEVTVSRK